jgi:hypothetical protein
MRADRSWQLLGLRMAYADVCTLSKALHVLCALVLGPIFITCVTVAHGPQNTPGRTWTL